MSMGCTEPSAIAYATSYAKEQISDSESITKVVVTLSSNVLKNALCVSLPNTELNGIESIVLLALVKGKSEKKLTIFSDIQENDIKQVINLKDKINIEIKPKREGDPAVLIANNRKAENILDWKPRINLEESIKNTYKFLLMHIDG